MHEKWLSATNYSSTVIASVIHFKTSGHFPAFCTTQEERDRFQEHFKDFKVKNGNLFYGDREVIENDPSEIRDAIEDTYKRDPAAVGKGHNKLFAYIQGKYIGITRKQVITYLKHQPEYQLTATHPRIASRGLQVTSPFQTWAIDLIDMQFYDKIAANKGYKYILSVLDMFSRYVWLIPLKKKEAANVKAGFATIILKNKHKFDTAAVKSKLPGAVWSDNGTEFAGEFSEYLKENHSTQLHNKAYVPVADIENANKTVRQIMRAVFVKYQKLDWVSRLQEIALSINTNYNMKLRTTPLQIMNDFHNRDDELINEAAQRRRDAAEAKFTRYSNQELDVGDHVRVRLASVYSNLRARLKAGTGKLNVVTYSPTVFIIVRKFPPPEGRFGYASYIVQDANGKTILSNGKIQRFRMNELVKVPAGLTAPNPMTQVTADELNRVKDSGEVVEQDEPAAAPAPLPPPLKPFSLWNELDFTKNLKGRQYTSDGDRFCIIDIKRSPAGLFTRVCSVNSLKKDGTPRKDAQLYKTDLAFTLNEARGEAWFTSDYGDFVDENLND